MPRLCFKGDLLLTSEIDDDDLVAVAAFNELRMAESCCCLFRTTELPGCSRFSLLGELSLAAALLPVESEELFKLLLLMLLLLMALVAVVELAFSGFLLEWILLYDLGALLADAPLLSCRVLIGCCCCGGERTK